MKYLKSFRQITESARWERKTDFIYNMLTAKEMLEIFEKRNPSKKLSDIEDKWMSLETGDFLADLMEDLPYEFADEWEEHFNGEEDREYMIDYILKTSTANHKFIEIIKRTIINKDKAYQKEDLEVMDLEDVLKSLNNKIIKHVIENMGIKEEFCEYYLREKHSTPYDLLTEIYDEDSLNSEKFFRNNERNILNYLYPSKIKSKNGFPSYSYEYGESYLDYLVKDIVGLLMTDYLSRYLFNKNPEETARFYIEHGYKLTLFKEYEFQKAYLRSCNSKEPPDVWEDMQTFVNLGIEINPEITKEYELEVYQEAEKFNM